MTTTDEATDVTSQWMADAPDGERISVRSTNGETVQWTKRAPVWQRADGLGLPSAFFRHEIEQGRVTRLTSVTDGPETVRVEVREVEVERIPSAFRQAITAWATDADDEELWDLLEQHGIGRPTQAVPVRVNVSLRVTATDIEDAIWEALDLDRNVERDSMDPDGIDLTVVWRGTVDGPVGACVCDSVGSEHFEDDMPDDAQVRDWSTSCEND